MIRQTICKHIHAVVRINKTPKIVEQQLSDPNEAKVRTIYKAVCTASNDIQSERQFVMQKLAYLMHQVEQCSSVQGLQAVKVHINFACNTLKTFESNINIAKHTNIKHEPPNKSVQLQRKFHSTRKRPRTVNVRITKPSLAQKQKIWETLLESKMKAENKICVHEISKFQNRIIIYYSVNKFLYCFRPYTRVVLWRKSS